MANPPAPSPKRRTTEPAKPAGDRPVVFPISAAPSRLISQVTLATIHYNPCGYRRMRETYYEWLPTLGPLAQSLVCYELVFDDDRTEIEGSRVIRGTRQDNAMWQKEPLLNIALANCKTPYFAWVDHDMVFQNPNWLSQAIKAITDKTPAVQLFSRIDYLRLDRTYHHSIPSCTSLGRARRRCNPGGMWLAQTNWLRRVGGFPIGNIVGGGDATFLSRHCDQTSHIEGAVYHLWHGSQGHRQHGTRQSILSRHGFDASTDIRLNSDGILEWASEKPKLQAEVREFFQRRREDG
ncbi:glycosyltransferase family 2 protein [Novipirellula maiorica]|nr:glycosyltransferase family 2 protein [Rhodopirellula maiorica]